MQIVTIAVWEVIFVPPDAPVISLTFPVALSMMIVGHVEERGIFPGLMKLFGEGGIPKSEVMLGDEKSSISSFMMMPVLGDITREPKLEKKHQHFKFKNK